MLTARSQTATRPVWKALFFSVSFKEIINLATELQVNEGHVSTRLGICKELVSDHEDSWHSLKNNESYARTSSCVIWNDYIVEKY